MKIYEVLAELEKAVSEVHRKNLIAMLETSKEDEFKSPSGLASCLGDTSSEAARLLTELSKIREEFIWSRGARDLIVLDVPSLRLVESGSKKGGALWMH